MVIPELCVFDINVTKVFYLELLGFELLYERPEEGFAMVQKGTNKIMLDQVSSETRSWLVEPFRRPMGNGVNLQCEIENTAGFYNTLSIDPVVSFYMELETAQYRVDERVVYQDQFIVQDPDGYLLRFCTAS